MYCAIAAGKITISIGVIKQCTAQIKETKLPTVSSLFVILRIFFGSVSFSEFIQHIVRRRWYLVKFRVFLNSYNSVT